MATSPGEIMAKFREQYEILIRWLAHRVRNICSRSGRMASLYYFVFSRKFDREHLSVLQGKQRYAHFFGFWGESSPRLRRNIHRLEKGLIMRPRRNVFAESFIAETVDLFRLASDSSVFDEGELKWACDVLREYFCAVEPTPVVKAASTHFHSIIASVRSQGKTISYSPYPHRCLPDIDLAIDELERLCTRRRSVRWYQDLAVTRESIENAVRIAALAPSACSLFVFW